MSTIDTYRLTSSEEVHRFVRKVLVDRYLFEGISGLDIQPEPNAMLKDIPEVRAKFSELLRAAEKRADREMKKLPTERLDLHAEVAARLGDLS